MRIWSAVLIQTKGWRRSFHPVMNWRILALRSFTEAKVLNLVVPDIDAAVPELEAAGVAPLAILPNRRLR